MLPILICTGAGLLYAYQLEAASLWLDEAISFWSAQVDWSQPVRALESGNVRYQPLYFLLLRGSMAFGTSEGALRLLSVVGAVLAVGLAYGFVRRYYGRSTALAACLLLVLNPLFLSHAQEARAYTLLVAATILATWLFVRTAETGGRRQALAYGATVGLAIYLHAFIIWMVLAHGVALLSRPWSTIRLLPFAAAAAVAALIGAPLAVVMFTQGSDLSWIPAPTLAMFSSVVEELGGGGWGALALLLAAAAAAAALSRDRDPSTGWPTTVLLSTLVVPLCGAALASLAVPMLLSRYLIALAFPLTALAAIGLLRLRVRWLSLVLVGAALGLMVQPVVAHYERPTIEDWRSAVASILDRSRSGDVILIHAEGARQPYEYYVRQDSSRPPPRVLYPSGDWQLGDFKDANSSTPLSSAVADAMNQPRVWVVLSHARNRRETDLILDALETSHVSVDSRTFTGSITVLLYTGPN